MSSLFLARCSLPKETKKKHEFTKWFTLFTLFNLSYIDDSLRVIMRRARHNTYAISTNHNYVEARYSFPFHWVLFSKTTGNCLRSWGA